MRPIGIFGTVLAVGVALAACSGPHGRAAADGRGAQHGNVGAQEAMPVSPGTSAGRARFAALPDRGELLRYDPRSPVREGAYTWHRAELSERHALDAMASGMLRLKTPDGRALGFRFDRIIRHEDSGDWTWIGHLPGAEGVRAIVTFGAGAVYGSIGQRDARPLRLTMRGGASWLVETDPARFAAHASHAANPIAHDYRIVAPAALQRLRVSRPAAATTRQASSPARAGPATATATTVDLLIGYTQGFASANGGTTNAITRLNSMVDTANVGLRDSQVNGQVRLVHAMQVGYTDTNSNGAALDQLTGYDSDRQEPSTPNAAFAALRAARDQYGADLVTLVRPFKDPEQDSCGIAWLVGGGKQGDTVSAENGWDYFGYAIVSDGIDANEADGNTYYCEEHTLAHEFGHSLGSQHDRETSKGDDDMLDDPDDYGAFPYSFGYKPTVAGKNFYTIMAYGDSGQMSYLVFSNPRVKLCGGYACGVNNSEDNAKSIGVLMPPVSGFRPTVAAPPGTWRIFMRQMDVNGDGTYDLVFFDHRAGKVVTWLMSGPARKSYSTTVVDGRYALVDGGDFNGDGRDDLLFADPQARRLLLATSAGTKYTLAPIALAYSQGMFPAGTADVNRDGMADILFRNGNSGRVTVWYMSGASRKSYSNKDIATSWDFVGSGDFDGDGRGDLLWTNDQNQLLISRSNGTSFTDEAVDLAYQQGYIPSGTQDVNGDGKADIVLMNVDQSRVVVWFMDGATRKTYSSTALGYGNVLVGKGDFDGDGRGDLLMQDPDVRWIRYLSSTGSAFSPVDISIVPSDGMWLMDVDRRTLRPGG